MTMTMTRIMIMTMIMIIIMIMIMTMTMVSYHHHEAPTAVRGSAGGCSMDMWCPYGIIDGQRKTVGIDNILSL